MTNEEFRYWISGYFALSTEDFLSKKQILIIKNHANLVKAITGTIEADIEDFLEAIESNLPLKLKSGISDLKKKWLDSAG